MKNYLNNLIHHIKTNPKQDGVVFIIGFIIGAILL